MKSTYTIVWMLMFFATVSYGQVSLPYYSGFDTPAERNGWTIYRLGDPNASNWSIATVGGFSLPACISHDYSPSTGIDVADDWYVSPGFLIPTGGTLDSVRYAFSGFSVPAAGDTIGVYLLTGDQDPAAASDIIELEEFRDDEYVADNVYRLLSAISLPATDEMAFIGLRYRNAEVSSRWLHVRFDNVAVSSNTTSIDEPGKIQLLKVYPNPATEEVTISHSESGGTVYLYDIVGGLLQKCELAKGQTTTTLSLMPWPQGHYRLVLQEEKEFKSATITRI